MFNFSKHEKTILLALSLILLTGLGFRFYKKNSQAITPAVKSLHLETVSLEKINKIIREYSVININTAAIEDLRRLYGIGPALAQRIIKYRNEQGAFASKEELLKVKGIGPKIFEQIEESICIE